MKNIDPEKLSEMLNQYGRIGWELISTFDIKEGAGYSKEVILIFKRPVAD